MRKSFTLLFTNFSVLLCLLICLAFTVQQASAQATSGILKGTVVDPNGEVVPGASVTAKNEATGVETSTTATGSGIFVIPNLIPGTYSVNVKPSTGFKAKTISNVAVRLGLETDLKVDLEIGSAQETVTIISGGEELASTNSEISTNFETRKVNDLPSNAAGSGIDTLALNVPGVTPGFGNVNSNGITLSVNGNRARSNNFSIDGTDNNDLSIGGPSYFVSNEEIVEEFQIITNNFSAQYGRNQGAIVNIVTKSGTNGFHGSAFEYHRNASLLDAMTNIERRTSTRSKRDKFINNFFGGTLGGPIIKNKLFFFGSYAGIRSRQNFTSRGTQIAVLASEFSRLRAAFPGNAAIQALTSQSAFALTNFGTVRPRPDRTPTTVCISAIATDCPASPAAWNPATTYAAAFPEREFALPFKQNEVTIRGDWNATSRDNVSVRYLWQDNVTGNALGGSNGFTGDQPATSKNLSGFYTRQLSSNISNNFQATFQQLSVIFGGGCTDPLTGCIPDPAEIANSYTSIVFGGVTGANGTALQTMGGATNLPQGRIVDVYQFSDKVSWIAGAHTFTFGADVRYLKNSVPFLPNINGVFRYNSRAALATNTPSNITLADGNPQLSYKEWDQFYFIQDDWKVLRNLTLNLGVRYEYTGQPINLLNSITTERESDPAKALYRQSLPIEARIVPAIPSDKNNFAPRLGFAWSPDFGEGNRFTKFLFGDADDTVIRGGFSIAYDPVFYNIMLNISTSAPVVILDTFTNTVPMPVDPTGATVRNAAASRLRRNTFDPRLLAQTVVSPDFHSPYSQQFSLGIQRQINSNNVFEIRYVGNRGKDLFQTNNANPQYANLYNGFTANVAGVPTVFPSFRNLLGNVPAPQVCVNDPGTPDDESACNGRLLAGRGLIRSRENTGSSQYDSLQTRYNGRFINKSLIFGASYTFSKALDNASEIFSFGENAIAQNPFDVEQGERSFSGFDRRHAFSMNLIYDLPFYRNQSGFVGKLLGGWQINSTYNLASGRRYTPEQFRNQNFASYQDNGFTGTFFGIDNLRPFLGNPNADVRTVGITVTDARLSGLVTATQTSPTGFFLLNDLNRIVGGQRVLTPVSPNDVRFIFNGPGAAAVFGTPFGNVPRNSVLGPALNQVNMGVFKTTNITERVKIQFRAEAFNLLNRPNAGFGVATSTGANPGLPDLLLENAGVLFADKNEINQSSRRIQLGVRVIF